jgi:molybdenum cofactor cytidylyltransferase
LIAGVVLAAGEGARFGKGPKQLAELDGRLLLQHAVDAQLGVPALEQIVVVLGARADEIEPRIDFGDADPVRCDEWDEGLAASLRCGLEALGEDLDAVLITLGDQPRITSQVIAMVLDHGLEAREPATRAAYDSRPGHPVLLRAPLLTAARELQGDHGARELLSAVKVRTVEASQLCSDADVDTPEQLSALRT